MRISAVLDNVKNLPHEELASLIKRCEQALLENKAAASSSVLYARSRSRILEQTIAALKKELQSRN